MNPTEVFAEEGVAHLPNALSSRTLALAEAAYEWSLAHPGPGASRLPNRSSGLFYQDLANPKAFAAYDALIRQPDILDCVRSVWRTDDVWFMYEQVFKKSGEETRRTPWHQDTSYLPVMGQDLVVMWMSFEPVDLAATLEFVAGSHQGPLYDGSNFDVSDDTAPLYGDGSMPRLPDIEADRSRFRILSWATKPGDVVMFHPSVLHGGGATHGAQVRRTLSLRFFGEDAVIAARPGRRRRLSEPVRSWRDRVNPDEHPLTRMREGAVGAPFRDPAFPRLSQ